MAFKLLDAGAILRTITNCRALDGGTLRKIIRMKVMDSDDTTLRTVATFVQPLSLLVSDAFADGYDSVQSAQAYAAPTGGLGPYSYSWAYVSGTVMGVFAPTTASPTFSSPALSPGQFVTAVYRCTCTDSSGQTATADSTVAFSFLIPPF